MSQTQQHRKDKDSIKANIAQHWNFGDLQPVGVEQIRLWEQIVGHGIRILTHFILLRRESQHIENKEQLIMISFTGVKSPEA